MPQLLRFNHHTQEFQHEEHMKALEQGQPLPRARYEIGGSGSNSRAGANGGHVRGRHRDLLSEAYKTDSFFGIALTVWAVAGVVSLAAITGGVALMGRLAQLGPTSRRMIRWRRMCRHRND